MRVGVGSLNPVKIDAVRRAFLRAFPNREVSIYPKRVEYKDQPIGFDEIISGARKRARESLMDFGVGIEAGIVVIHGFKLCLEICVILDKEGKTGIGMSPAFQYDLKSTELGKEMEERSGILGIGEKGGTVNYLTRGLVDRREFSEKSVLMALIPWLNI